MNRFFTALVLFVPLSSIFAQQPFDSFQTSFSVYPVNPDSCIRIDHPSGSIIFIEAGGIPSGKGPVAVHYREHLTPLDMLIHGIPMHAQLGDQKLQLESSGMFEIYAISEGDTLAFNPSKRMEVRLNNPLPRRPGTEGYKFDPSLDAWGSYTSRINRSEITDDSNLWGNSPFSNQLEQVEDGFDSFGGFASAEDGVTQKVFQSMEIDDFGFYNYDRMIEGLEYVYLKPNFRSQDDAEITSTIYVVYDDINSVFYFPEYTWEEEFFLIPNKDFKLFSLTEKGAIAKLMTVPDVKSLGGKAHEFKLEVQSARPETKYDVAQITGIQ